MNVINMNIKRVTQTVLYGIVIMFFAYTLANKVLMFDSFLINIAKTGLFQCKLAIYAVAIFALLAEMASITLLIYKKKWGFTISLGMMIVFTLYILVLNFTGKYEVCGCGGILNGLSFVYHFTINLTLIIILIYLIRQS